MPIKEFGRENHRALSYLPQHPILKSVPRKRLMMSWWDGEVSVWTFPRHASIQMARKVSPVAERSDEGKTVAKILIQVSPAFGLRAITINNLLLGGRVHSICGYLIRRQNARSLNSGPGQIIPVEP